MTVHPSGYINRGNNVDKDYGSAIVKYITTSVLTTIGAAYQPCVIVTGQVQNLIWQRWKLLLVLVVIVMVMTSGVELTIAIPAGK
ncbi:hypothetical protein GCM10010149_64710 [Nonomuraea roseoviolacea subsp. roseoviolacea]|uniref:hypothetical protein n=1 Tax=Nonomuraea roseoviolacea TaxID=103837 RepID=UPI0031DA49A5